MKFDQNLELEICNAQPVSKYLNCNSNKQVFGTGFG